MAQKNTKTKTKNIPLLQDNAFLVKRVNELNFFSLYGTKSVSGTSNKMYHIELQIAKDNSGKSQIFTVYGPTGSVQKKEWRHYDNEYDANKEYEKLLKSKRKKGYKDIDVAQRALGTDEAKTITKAVTLKNADHLKKTRTPKSLLDSQTQSLMKTLFGATQDFVTTTLKCPLGQLTNQQIDDGRSCLEQAKKIVNSAKSLSKKQRDELLDVTNNFYGLIPHNLGAGARGQMTHLILDDLIKIARKEDDLDTLLDAKSVGAVLAQTTKVDDQYKSLNAEFKYIDRNTTLFNWINNMVQKTRASNHRYLGRIKILNVWELKRNNEFDIFISNADKIGRKCKGQKIPEGLRNLVKTREDISKEYDKLYKNANVLPLFHGTRTQNIVGITKQGILIRPAGAIITGAMYGSGAIYKAKNSTKSINYTNIKSSYWAKGSDNKAFLFLNDCILGDQLIAKGPRQYTRQNISPYHSVWAKSGVSGIINDEFMLYTTTQHTLRYLIEFTCQKN